ncbi:MAG TPA: FHA domain-containing protein [Chloroflexota bacterium]|nr:FHA domain-containing protein [Chloroflexota bacterium]
MAKDQKPRAVQIPGTVPYGLLGFTPLSTFRSSQPKGHSLSVDVLLFWGRIVFLVGLYLFLTYLVLSLTRDLRARSASPEEIAPGELVIVEPAESGLRPNDAFPLMSETLLGRAPENTIAIPDTTISGRHSRLVHGRAGWEIEDLDSRNGTFVNGKQVKRSKVAYGDIVSLGEVTMKLVRLDGRGRS